MLALKTKQKPDPSIGDAAFAVARAEFQKAKALWDGLAAKEENLRAASIWLSADDTERASDRFAWCREKIATAWPDGNPPRRHRIAGLLQDVRDEIDAARPGWLAAREAWEIAKRRETTRLAVTLQERQRRAVARMHDALCELSSAMAAEAAVREELARNAPMPTSPNLPDVSLPIDGFERWDSPISQWARRCKAIGVLS